MSPSYERRSGGPSRKGPPGSGAGRNAGGRGTSGRPSNKSRFSDKRSSENRSSEKRSYGDRPYGDRSYGDRAGGSRFTGNRFSDNRSGDNRSGENRSGDKRFSDNRFSDNRSGANRSGTNRSETSRSETNPRAKRSSVDRFSTGGQGNQRFGKDRSAVIRGRDGERPRFEDWGRSGRSHDERPRRNDRPSQGNSNSSFRSNRPPDRRRSGDERRQSSQGQRFNTPSADRDHSSPRGVTGEASSANPPADDLIWGRHATQAALETGRPIHRIWCTPEMRSAAKFLQLLREAKACGVLVEEVTWARLGQITGGSVHQGIALQTAAAETLDLSTLIEGCADLGESPLLLALDGVTDPQNLGAVVRSAEAMGAHGVVLPQRRSAGLTGSVAKVAAGALEHLPVARVVNLNRSLETLKDAGYRVIGLAAEGDVTITDVDFSGPLVLVTGSEDQGLSLLTRRHCDQLVRIPLRGITPSLNASVATALCVYEVARRNWMKDIHGQAPSPPLVRPRKEAEPEVSAEIDQPSLSDSEQVVEINLTTAAPEAALHFDESIQLSP